MSGDQCTGHRERCWLHSRKLRRFPKSSWCCLTAPGKQQYKLATLRFLVSCSHVSRWGRNVFQRSLECAAPVSESESERGRASKREREGQRVRESESQRVRESESQRVERVERVRQREGERERQRETESELHGLRLGTARKAMKSNPVQIEANHTHGIPAIENGHSLSFTACGKVRLDP